MSGRRCAVVGIGLVAVCGWGGTVARGDPGIEPLLEPWSPARYAEAEGAIRTFEKGKEERHGTSLSLEQVTSDGRWRLSQDLPINPTIAYDATFFRLGGGPSRLPNELLDISAGVSSPLFGDEKLFFAGSLGLGYAGDQPFSNGKGWYGKADVVVGHAFDDTRTLLFFLDYDGNRTLLPDVPIPAVAYADESNPDFQFVLGAPLSLADWKPTDKIDVIVRVEIPESYEIEIDYRITKGITLYALAENDDYRFAQMGLGGSKRLLFKQNLVEAGVSYRPWKYTEFTAAVGYGFSQAFGIGFDARDYSHQLDISDEPYLRFGLELSY